MILDSLRKYWLLQRRLIKHCENILRTYDTIFSIKRKEMPKIKQNLVLLVEPPEGEYDISLKAGNMYLNRFCIDEDASFELSGVYNLKKRPNRVVVKIRNDEDLTGKLNYCE